jgi:hypothetical protein
MRLVIAMSFSAILVGVRSIRLASAKQALIALNKLKPPRNGCGNPACFNEPCPLHTKRHVDERVRRGRRLLKGVPDSPNNLRVSPAQGSFAPAITSGWASRATCDDNDSFTATQELPGHEDPVPKLLALASSWDPRLWMWLWISHNHLNVSFSFVQLYSNDVRHPESTSQMASVNFSINVDLKPCRPGTTKSTSRRLRRSHTYIWSVTGGFVDHRQPTANVGGSSSAAEKGVGPGVKNSGFGPNSFAKPPLP